MKLLVIVLCLLSERYLVHAMSLKRFDWYAAYWKWINAKLLGNSLFTNHYAQAAAAILPIFLTVAFVLALFCNFLFGFVYLLLNIVLFYYCIGPVNPFYPVEMSQSAKSPEKEAENYFAVVNQQVFAIIFWYIVFGPLAVLIYRLIDVTAQQRAMSKPLKPIMNVLDWIPARVTVMLYLLVGNFQHGLAFFLQNFIATPEKNTLLLGRCGLLAARLGKNDEVSLPVAQTLVEHALVVYLVFLAFFTLVSWL